MGYSRKTFGNTSIVIGSDCIIGGNLVVENKKGQITIGSESTIGAGSMLVAGDASITIGNHVVVSFNVIFYNTYAHSLDYIDRRHDVTQTLEYLNGDSSERDIHWNRINSADIVVEDDAWICFGATIMKGVRIGRGAIVGAKSVVTYDVEPFTVVAGNPACVVKRI